MPYPVFAGGRIIEEKPAGPVTSCHNLLQNVARYETLKVRARLPGSGCYAEPFRGLERQSSPVASDSVALSGRNHCQPDEMDSL
jgi:hypothetical protein